VVRFDYRGNGLSDGNFRDTRIATLVEDLSLVLDAVSPNALLLRLRAIALVRVSRRSIGKNILRASVKLLFFGAAFDHASISRYVTLKTDAWIHAIHSAVSRRESCLAIQKAFAPVETLLEKAIS
jgi:hypothetical protein